MGMIFPERFERERCGAGSPHKNDETLLTVLLKLCFDVFYEVKGKIIEQFLRHEST
jgi:hypothetical protein